MYSSRSFFRQQTSKYSPSINTAKIMDGARQNEMPSIKTGKIMDDRRQNDLPSIKTAKIMDGRRQKELPSIKTGQIMDDRRQKEVPSMKTGEIMDGRSDKPAGKPLGRVSAQSRPSGQGYLTQTFQPAFSFDPKIFTWRT